MQNQIILYVSAASDLMLERDQINRSVVEIPLDIGWRIVQSPLKEADGPLRPELVAAADLHLLLLGGDIRAPIGQEWTIGLRNGRVPLCLLKKGVNRTAAAEDFRRFVGLQTEWRSFDSVSRLRAIFLDYLAEALVRRADRIGMTPAEYDRLMTWRGELDEMAESNGDQRDRQSALGESSVILTHDRLRPEGGELTSPPNF